QGKKKETELKLKARVPAFELFIGNEGRAKEEIKRPAHPKSAAAEVENHKSAQQASEEKLQDIEEPIVELRGPTFPFAIDILPAIQPKDAERDDEEMDNHPEVFPEHVNPLQGDRVEDEATNKRNGGERETESRVAGARLAYPFQQ